MTRKRGRLAAAIPPIIGHSGFGAEGIPVIKQMLGKSQMVVRMTPYGESPFTAMFNVAGLDEATSPLREACHW